MFYLYLHLLLFLYFFFFFNDPATTEIYTLSLHDALPILPTFFGCSKFCSDDRRRSSHEFADLAHPGRCTSSCCRRSEEHTSELQSRVDLVCRLLLEKKKKKK